MGYHRRGFPPLQDTAEAIFSNVGYNGKIFVPLLDTPQNNFKMFDEFHFCCIPQSRSFFPLYPTPEQFSLLFYPTPQKNLLRCIPQRKRFCFIVEYRGEKLYNTKYYLFNFWRPLSDLKLKFRQKQSLEHSNQSLRRMKRLNYMIIYKEIKLLRSVYSNPGRFKKYLWYSDMTHKTPWSNNINFCW